MEIRQLKTFLSIIRTGRFTRAAELLGYAQSAVTAHIQSLEEELQTQLFERFGRTTRLTADGERLLPFAERIVALSEETIVALAQDTAPRGSLIVGAAETLVNYRFASKLQDFCSRFPDVHLSLCYGGCNEFRSALRSNSMDVAFLMDVDVTDSDFIAHRLREEPTVFAVAPDHPIACLVAIGPQDLNNQTLILTEAGCYYRICLEAILQNLQIFPRSVVTIGQIEPILQLVRSGSGIAFLPRVALEAHFAAGTLVELPWEGPEIPVFDFLVHHREKWISPALRIFLDIILADH